MSQIFTALPKLREIAAANVALALWNHFNVFEWYSKEDSSDLLNKFKPEVMKLTKDLLLPKIVLKLIQTYIITISSEISKWIIHHQENISSVRNCHWLRHFSEIIWHPNCTINYKETARNLQNSKFLNEVEKFEFLCLYCFKNEIEQKRKFFGNNFFNKVSFRDYPLVYYWDRHCRNRLQYASVTEGLSIDEFMFRHPKVDIWPAKEYFFDRMNVNEQIQNTIWIIDQSKVSYQKLIIAKLNQSQRETLYINRSLQILKNYMSDSKYFDNILPTWFEAAPTISNEGFAIFLRKLFLIKINDRIILEIWISASVSHKLHVLKSENEATVLEIWNLWMQSYHLNMINLLLDTDWRIIKIIRNTRVFSAYCECALAHNKLLMLEKVLNLCFESDEALTPVKQKLARSWQFGKLCVRLILSNDFFSLEQLFGLFSEAIDLDLIKKNIVGIFFFKNHCKKLVKNGEIPVLDKLLNMFCSSKIEELDKSIRKRFGSVYMIDCCKKLLNEEKLPAIATLLDFFRFGFNQSIRLKYFVNYCEKLKERCELSKLENLLKSLFPSAEELIVFRRAFSRKVFRDHFQKSTTSDQLLKLNETLNSIFPSVEESVQFKKYLNTKNFFINYCLKLMLEGELQRLQTLFECFCPCTEELITLKQAISKEKSFGDHCQNLIISGQLLELDEMLNLIFLNVEESVQFKHDLSTKRFFIDHCLKLIIDGDLQTLKKLFAAILPCMEKLTRFKQLVREKNVFDDHCQSLIIGNQLSNLDELLDLFFSNAKEISAIKGNIVEKSWFTDHYQNLMNSYQLTILDELLTWCFPDNFELNRFKSNLSSSNFVKEKCLFFYRTGNIESLNNLLNLLLDRRYELIFEYKQNLLLSEDGVKVCFFLANRPNSILEDVIIDCLPTSSSITDLKKKLIFSSVALSILKQMTQEDLLSDVKKCFDQFLTSAEDRMSLKKRLLDDPIWLIMLLFFKYDRSVCESEMKWWFEDETVVNQCKSTLSVDTVFMDGLKECVFQKFDPFRRVSRCVFKEKFDLESLDRFLSWYFESSKEVKEFKIKMMKLYKDVDTISLLLTKGCRYSYFKELFSWFFENDVKEIIKFKRCHEGEKISSKINIVFMNNYRVCR